ncbi:hypothetical protein AWM68_17440 [Fictibacillus phosphorivorans]|uniref:DUF2325 domain-containing protein n=1 Tax=Fictibacillus phosphorivorans TaxID=1221500 RepID=A0A161RUM9_9BACL|nr:DUF2325 domain-containing protein [Fictibacillus phosphorivorans]KZE67956.1 hypothetical protein AWM68_17440 [Fictibacillus phosphorivorans]
MQKTVAIFGGSQEGTYKKIGQKHGLNVLFHCGKSRNGGSKKEFKSLVKKADCVVMLYGALGHVSMDIVKDLCKSLNKQFVCHEGFGASGAIQKSIECMDGAAA